MQKIPLLMSQKHPEGLGCAACFLNLFERPLDSESGRESGLVTTDARGAPRPQNHESFFLLSNTSTSTQQQKGTIHSIFLHTAIIILLRNIATTSLLPLSAK